MDGQNQDSRCIAQAYSLCNCVAVMNIGLVRARVSGSVILDNRMHLCIHRNKKRNTCKLHCVSATIESSPGLMHNVTYVANYRVRKSRVGQRQFLPSLSN